jgi:penicillin V acylase-like amidase (Ntn superfamily)
MKKIIVICIMTLLIGTAALQVSACTGFTASDGETVLVGSNEDWHDNNFNLRFFPPEDGKHGMMFFEIASLMPDGTTAMSTFAGMNDQGLWYDGYATPYLLPVNSSEKPYFTDPDLYYKDDPAEYCSRSFSTIEEVVDFILDYNSEAYSVAQLLIADGNGNSVIFEGDDFIYKDGDFQVVTNFLQSHPELGGLGNSFERYDIAVSMLENMTELTVDYFTDICNETHQQKTYSWTVYSWICDLKNQIVYLYHLYDYDNVVVIDLKEELEKGEHYIYVGSLFEPERNQAPEKHEAPTGNESGSPGEIYSYSVRKIKDPDGDSLSYMWDWGDGTYSYWLQASSFGPYFSIDHSWSEEGTYEVRVKARDVYGRESDWSDPLVVSMPKNKSLNEFNPWIIRLIERFPILELLI